MNACMHGLIVARVCVCVYDWVIRSTCLQGGAVSITSSGEGTFTNCDFTSYSAGHVSLEEEHVDGCEMSNKCMTLRLCPPCISS